MSGALSKSSVSNIGREVTKEAVVEKETVVEKEVAKPAKVETKTKRIKDAK